MRVLVISDIHSNLTALESVLDDAGQFDAAWCLGDLVGYGPDPNECIEAVRKLPNLSCVIGNHDAAVLGQLDLESFNRDARLAVEWTQDNLTLENFAFLGNLPEKVQVDSNVTLAHGSPRNPIWEYLLDSYTALENFKHFETRYCFVGHTHLPVAFLSQNGSTDLEWKISYNGNLGDRAILNPGSVGQPRDHNPLAAYAIYDTETTIWEPHRVDYNIPAVQQRITMTGLPRRHAVRLEDGW